MPRLVQSMFIRRLLGLFALTAAGLGVLWLRLADLTVVQGAELRDAAQQRLVREQWLPTTRGTIFDRTGRVLAQDRASFVVSLDYQVLAGDWARAQARRAAVRMAGVGWSQMSRAERDEVIAHVLPIYQGHVDAGLDLLALRLGLSPDELRARRAEVVSKVQARHQQVVKSRVEQARQRALEASREWTDADAARAVRELSGPIAEMRRPHAIAPGVNDALGFAALALADEQVELRIPADGPLAALLGLEADRTELVPVVPGLSVLDSGERDYPLETMLIDVDTSTFPSPVRAGTVQVRVEGVLAHALGRVRTQIYGDATDPRTGRLVPGDQTRRRQALDADAQLRALAMTPAGRDRGAYREGDIVGESGIEASQELALRGLRGLVRTDLETNQRELLEAVRGRDVTLTIDAKLQANIQAVMSPDLGLSVVQHWHGSLNDRNVRPLGEGTPLAACVVVLDIDSGDILAAVSTPTVGRAQFAQEPQRFLRDGVMTPLVNRAWAAEYPPGSTIKPMIYAGASQLGLVQPGETIACNGFFLPNRPNQLQCLIWKRFRTTHSETMQHDPNAVEAIGVSCNIYFYTLGDRLRPAGIRQVYEEFGVTRRFGLGAGYEAPGRLGSAGAASITPGDAIQMGIGQGPATWTPLHAAHAYATIARAGTVVAPRLVMGAEAAASTRLSIPPGAIQRALDGLDYAVNNPRGTGHHLPLPGGGREPIFNVPNVKIWGKTGTATAPDLVIDPDGPDGPQEPIVARSGDHSWFVILAGRDRPRYSIAVIVEYGGSGAKVSGPIANQAVWALVREGYL